MRDARFQTGGCCASGRTASFRSRCTRALLRWPSVYPGSPHRGVCTTSFLPRCLAPSDVQRVEILFLLRLNPSEMFAPTEPTLLRIWSVRIATLRFCGNVSRSLIRSRNNRCDLCQTSKSAKCLTSFFCPLSVPFHFAPLTSHLPPFCRTLRSLAPRCGCRTAVGRSSERFHLTFASWQDLLPALGSHPQ